jgi:hypothetical protein
VKDRQRLPPIQHDTPLFIDDNAQPQTLKTFLDNDRSLARTRDTYVFLHVFLERPDSWQWSLDVAVSFVGPSSGNLILRLKHHAFEPNTTITVLGTSFTLTIPESLTTDDINLHPIGNSSSQLSFMPNTRNNLILQVSMPRYYYIPQDVQLLDEDGNPYGQPSQRMPDDHESS